jgi:Ser/Thr protein kinase RdoA (MazF antagonist)
LDPHRKVFPANLYEDGIMDPKIAARYTDNILASALSRYDIAAERIHPLDGFESFLYEFERPDGRFILRIGHSLRRTPDLIRGEVDWINFLADGGATVARAVLSADGRLVEPIDDGQGGQFLCTAFVRAPGGEVRREHYNDRLFRNYGRLLGRMHALAQKYVLPDPAWKRPEWNDPANMYADLWLPEKFASLLPKYRRLVDHLETLPRDPDGYGMIHQDAHPGNFFVDADYTLTLFDFDDCVYGHFINDIAMVLFYTALNEPDRPAFAARFLPVFFSGYREENRLDPRWLPELPHFMKLREIDLFAEILFMDGEHPASPWSARYLLGRREKIESGEPVIDFDWLSLAQDL